MAVRARGGRGRSMGDGRIAVSPCPGPVQQIRCLGVRGGRGQGEVNARIGAGISRPCDDGRSRRLVRRGCDAARAVQVEPERIGSPVRIHLTVRVRRPVAPSLPKIRSHGPLAVREDIDDVDRRLVLNFLSRLRVSRAGGGVLVRKLLEVVIVVSRVVPPVVAPSIQRPRRLHREDIVRVGVRRPIPYVGLHFSAVDIGTQRVLAWLPLDGNFNSDLAPLILDIIGHVVLLGEPVFRPDGQGEVKVRPRGDRLCHVGRTDALVA